MKQKFRENESVTVRYAFSERDGEIAGPPVWHVGEGKVENVYPILFDDGSADPRVPEASIRPRGQEEMIV